MFLTLKAKFVGEPAMGVVELEVPGLRLMEIDGLPKLRMVDPSTGDRRELNRDEERDLEEVLEEFTMKCLGRALSEIVSIRR